MANLKLKKTNGRCTQDQLEAMRICYKYRIPASKVAEFLDLSQPTISYWYRNFKLEGLDRLPTRSPQYALLMEDINYVCAN